MEWTKEADTLLMDLWNQGFKTKEIGYRLGVSKGAVCGRHRRLVAKQPLTVHPAYDPIAKVWFLDKPKVEAESLELLLTKLPKGVIIEGYRKVA